MGVAVPPQPYRPSTLSTFHWTGLIFLQGDADGLSWKPTTASLGTDVSMAGTS